MDLEERIESEFDDDSTNTVENQNIITLGKCSHFYLLFLGSSLSKLFSLFLLGNKNITKKDIAIFGFCPVFNGYNFIQYIIVYFGYITLGIIFLIFKDVKKVEINESMKRKISIKTNRTERMTSKVNAKKNRIQLFFFSLLLPAHSQIKEVLYIEGFQSFHFWTFESLFILYLMRKYFINEIYIHHKVSIIFIISICSILILISTFLPKSSLGENSGNAYENIEKKL